MQKSSVTNQYPLTPLQEQFCQSGAATFSDQEIVELLAGMFVPPEQAAQRAKLRMQQFQNLRGFLGASPEELKRAGVSPRGIFLIKALNELPAEILKRKIAEQPVYQCSRELFEYLSYSMRDLHKEVFKVVCLNNRHQIVDVVNLGEGTPRGIPIDPRQVVESALQRNAVALIFAHNHPTGDPSPSKSDKQITRDLVFAGGILNIRVLDHIIIGKNTYFSFKDGGLIDKYEDSFLTLRLKAFYATFQNSPSGRPPLLRLHCYHRN